MNADINSIVQDLKQVKVEQVVFEAITNAIQADASRIEIHLDSINYDAKLDINEYHLIQKIKVIDNGHGFKEEDIKSFKTYRSTFKKLDFGSKGVGRFLYLKLFKNVEIKSLNKIISFSVSKDVKASDSNVYFEKTSIELLNSVNGGGGYQINKSEFTTSIKEHFLPYFKLLKEESQKIEFEIFYNKEAGSKFTSNEIPNFETDSFNINDHQFNISYLLNDTLYKRIDGVYCADNRVVTANSTLDQKAQFKAFSGINFFYMISSEYLDENLNDERDEFTIKPVQTNQSEMYKALSWTDIHQHLKQKVKLICLKHGINLDDKAKQYLDEAIKEAPYLVNYFKNNEFVHTDFELINNAKKRLEADKVYLRDANNTKASKYKLKLSKVVQAELAEYIFDRQKVIINLQSLVEDNELEKEIHSLFMKQYTSDINQDYRTNNLWLFDDRFMSYDKVFSDTQISKIFPELANNLKRPDILSISSNTYDKDEITDIVIIELKKPDANKGSAIAEQELINYARYVNDSKQKKIRVWTYAFLHFDSDDIFDLEGKSYNEIPTQDTYPIFYKYHEKPNTIINFIDYKALASDANARNKTFLNILKGSNHMKIDSGENNVIELNKISEPSNKVV